MADYISQITLPNNETYNIKDAKASTRGIEYIRGTWAAASGAWTGVSQDEALYDGKQILLYMPFAGSGNATLNLTLANGTTTGPINVYYESTSRFTTHKGAYSQLHLIYHVNHNINGTNYTGWWYVANRDTNDTTYYIRRIYPNIKAGAGSVHPYSIIMQLSNGRWSSITSTAPNNPGASNVSPKATGKSANTNGFLLGHVLLMYANATYADGSNVGTDNIWSAHSGLIDARYSFNLENTEGKRFTGYASVYIVGTVTNGLFYLDTTKWWTQTLPSSDDGKVYIYIGDAYDWYRLTFTEDKPIYWYKDEAVRLYSGASEYAISASSATTATKFASAQSITLTGDVTGTASSQAGWSLATTIGAGKVTNAMLAGSIANGKLANSKVTIAGNDVNLGGSLTAATLTSSLGLSNAMHFIGVVASNSANTPSDGTSGIPTITGVSSYTPAAGDVVIDKDNMREYVWSNGAWILLGFTTSSIYNSDSITASSSDEPTWISNIQQATDGKISIQRQTIGTLGVGHGGTGKSEWTQWGIIYASATDTLAQVTAGASNNTSQPLISGGSAAPKWYAGLTLAGDGTQESPYNATFNNTVTITGATTLTGKVGIGASPDSNYQLYVNGNSQFNGNLIPTITNNSADKTLGNSSNRWANVYIGTADTYGDVYTPIYWNDGVPTEVAVVQKYTFSIANNSTTTVITPTNVNKAKSIVTEIVVDNGIEYLNGPISWEIPITGANKDNIVLTTTVSTSGVVSGYILVSIG